MISALKENFKRLRVYNKQEGFPKKEVKSPSQQCSFHLLALPKFSIPLRSLLLCRPLREAPPPHITWPGAREDPCSCVFPPYSLRQLAPREHGPADHGTSTCLGMHNPQTRPVFHLAPFLSLSLFLSLSCPISLPPPFPYDPSFFKKFIYSAVLNLLSCTLSCSMWDLVP